MNRQGGPEADTEILHRFPAGTIAVPTGGNELHRELTEDRPKDERRKLLKLVDLEAELRDEISLASFTAGFRLAWGIIGELNIEPPYSFAEEEERRMGQLADLRRDD